MLKYRQAIDYQHIKYSFKQNRLSLYSSGYFTVPSGFHLGNNLQFNPVLCNNVASP